MLPAALSVIVLLITLATVFALLVPVVLSLRRRVARLEDGNKRLTLVVPTGPRRA